MWLETTAKKPNTITATKMANGNAKKITSMGKLLSGALFSAKAPITKPRRITATCSFGDLMRSNVHIKGGASATSSVTKWSDF